METHTNNNCWFKGTSICTRDTCDDCYIYGRMKMHFDYAGIPNNLQKIIRLVPDDCDTKSFNKLRDIKKDIYNWVQEGNNLYLCSHTAGNGKTSWAIKLLQSYLLQVYDFKSCEDRPGMFVSVSNLLISLKDFKNPQSASYLNHIKTADLVVWDDMAITGLSNYDYLQLYSYLDTRLLNGKSNIYTSNRVTMDELRQYVGDRLTSRIFSRNTEIITLRGGDNR